MGFLNLDITTLVKYLLEFLYFFIKYLKNGKHLDRQIEILLYLNMCCGGI